MTVTNTHAPGNERCRCPLAWAPPRRIKTGAGIVCRFSGFGSEPDRVMPDPDDIRVLQRGGYLTWTGGSRLGDLLS